MSLSTHAETGILVYVAVKLKEPATPKKNKIRDLTNSFDARSLVSPLRESTVVSGSAEA